MTELSFEELIPKEKKRITSDDVVARLRKRFGAPEYAFMEQVRNGVGFSANRTADAIAMGVWPSRGLHLVGFEVKVSRNDWLREKKKPEKGEDVIRYMDRWFLAVSDEAIVKSGELPATWGLIVVRGAGLHVAREAPMLKPKAIDRSLLAALLRNMANDQFTKTRIDAATAELREQHEQHLEQVRGEAGRDAAPKIANQLDALKAQVRAFEQKSGVRIDSYQADDIGAAVKLVIDAGVLKAPWGVEQGIKSIRTAADHAERALREFQRSATHPEAAKDGGGSGLGGGE